MERYNHLAQQLGQTVLAEGGLLRMQVNGSSMAPTLLPGDAIWVEPVSAEDLTPGDVVLARRAGDMVTHRLIFASETGWVLKGDALSFCDPPQAAEALIGRVVLRERKGRQTRLDSPEMRAASLRIMQLGRIESGLYLLSQQIGRRVFGVRIPGWAKQAGRLAAIPFRWIIRIL